MRSTASRVLAACRQWADVLPGWTELRQPRHFLLPLACLVAGLAITLLLAWRVSSDAMRVEREQFQRHGERVVAEVARRLTLPIYGLRGAAGAYAAARSLNHTAFRDYVESRDLPTEFPGVRGMGFIDRVARERLPAYTAEVSRDRDSEFVVRSEGNAPELFPVRYIEPLARNWQAVGLDLFSESVRRQALERAVSSGLPTLTGPISLVQDAGQHAGALLLLPTFRHGTDPDTPARRRHALYGLFYAPIVFEELLVGVGRAGDGQVALRMTDDQAPPERQVMFDDAAGAAAGRNGSARQSLTQALHIWGRSYSLTLSSTAQFERLSEGGVALFVLIGGITFSLGIAAMLWLLIAARADAEARAVRKSADQLRTQSLLQAVVDNLPCGLSVFDAQLNLVTANREFRRLLDFPDALLDAPKVNFEDIIRFNVLRGEYGEHSGLEEVERTVQAIVERARQPAQAHLIERQRPNGTPLEVRGAPMPSGGFVTTYTDVSTRKAAEAEVQRSAGLLRGAIDAIDEAFVLYDPEDRLVFCNDKYREIYPSMAHLMLPGARFEDIIRPGAEAGQYLEAIGRVDEWMAERLAAHRSGKTSLVQKLATGRRLRIVERKLPDGHIVGFRVDITELVEATEAAQQASHAKSQFLANISHEIRTPMNAILGMTALVIEGKLDDDQRELLEIVRRSADSLLALINDILDFSKIEAGQMTVESVEFDLHDCAADAALLLRERALDKGLALECMIAPDVPRQVHGDPHRLRQVLVNLLSNAIKFTERGWVMLSLAPAPTAAGVMFEVSDTGIGIAADKLEHVFQAFTQADESVTRRYGGTGLGLSISRDLVTSMGGRLAVTSVEGKGSHFHFSLALQPAPPGAVPGLPGIDPMVVVLDRAPTEDAALLDSLRHWQLRPVVARSVEQLLEAEQAPAVGTRLYFVKASWLPQADADQRARLWAAIPRAQRILLRDREADDAAVQQFDHRLAWPRPPKQLLDLLGQVLQSDAPDANGAGHEPRRVLLVDDNPINRKLAVRLLESMGHSVVTAEDGQRALEALERKPFDLVLMDLQMPVLGGIEATQRLRQTERGQARRTPVVAMTAHALHDDRQRCLDAGMDDHVTKPITRHALQRVVAQHALDSSGAENDKGDEADEPSAVSPPTQTAPALAATPTLDRGAALTQLGGDIALYDELIGMFVDSLPASRAELAQCDAGERLVRCAHALRGALSAIGAIKANAIAVALETAAHSGPPDTAQALHKQLLAELDTLGSALHAGHHHTRLNS